VIYGGTYFFSEKQFLLITYYFIDLIIKIIPIFFLVHVLMVFINYFISNEFLGKHLVGDSGIRSWLISIITGIISVGPIYMWYPLMKDLQKKGVKDRFLVTFLYNRGIKLQWLPMLVLYFGWGFSFTLLVVMATFSIPQGIITEKLIHRKSGVLLKI